MSTDMFLEFSNDIKGENESTAYPDWVEIVSWSHGFEQPSNWMRSSTGPTMEKITHNPFSITRKLDKASVPIMKACWSGVNIEKVVMVALRAMNDNEPLDYLVVEMLDVIITTYEISGGEGDIPEETLNFTYSYISYTYKHMNKLEGTAGEPIVHYTDLITGEVG